jgi:hypothetical protein
MLVVGTGVLEVEEEDEVGLDEVDEVVVVEETVELVELVELVLDVDELDDEVEELKAKEGGDELETVVELETDETCEAEEGVGEGDALEDGVVDGLSTGGLLPKPRAPRGGVALILIMRLRSTWSRR